MTQLINAVCFTLLHSLWQGAAIAGIAGLGLAMSRRAKAKYRYLLLLGCLVAFTLCTAYTLIYYLPAERMDKPQTPALFQLSINIYYNTAIDFITSHAIVIIQGWLLIVVLKCSWLTVGFLQVAALRQRHLSPIDEYWKVRIAALSKRLRIKRRVVLATSTRVSVPMVIGYLKPVIVIPLGLLTALPYDQIEAIILHELAHIRRHDYLVNIFQTCVETLFFFNPAVGWMSSLLREEREHCCDDLAVASGPGMKSYIKALLAFEEFQTSIPTLTASFTGARNQLLDRAKRLVNTTNRRLGNIEKMALIGGVIIAGAVLICLLTEIQPKRSLSTVPIATDSVLQHRIPRTTDNTNVDRVQKPSINKMSNVVGDAILPIRDIQKAIPANKTIVTAISPGRADSSRAIP